MAIRIIRLFVFVCFLMTCRQSMTALEWEGTLNDEAYHQFIEDYKKDPGALSKHADIFRKISSKQFYDMFTALGTTHFTYLYPVAIKGQEVPDLIGKDIRTLSLMAVRGNRFIPVPFQIDEYDITGLIYIGDKSPHKPKGTPGILDNTDEIVFMFRDAGVVPYNTASMSLTEGTILREIKLDPLGNDPRYIYLVEGNRQRSDADYVKVDNKTGKIKVKTTFHQIAFNPKNSNEIMEWSTQVGPHAGQNFIDNMYMEMSTGILSEHLRFKLNSHDNIHTILVGYKDGPVRASMLYKVRIWYWGMPTLFTEYMNENYFEQAICYPSRFSPDVLNTVRLFLKLIKRPEVELLVDLHNLQGARYTFQNAYDPDAPENMGVVDNKISAVERKIMATRLPGEWIYFDSNHGWTLFLSNQLHIKPEGLFNEYMEGMKIQMRYEDSLQSKRKYERYPGAEPLIGVTVEGFPHLAIDMLASLKDIEFSKIETFGELIDEMDRVGEKGAFKKMDEITNQAIAKMKKKGLIQSKEDLIKIVLDDIRIFKIKNVERKTIAGLVRRAMESEINEEMNNFNFWKLIHKGIQLAKEDGIDYNEFQYAVTDTILWFPDSLDNNDPEYFNQQTKNPPEVSILPYNCRTVGQQ